MVEDRNVSLDMMFRKARRQAEDLGHKPRAFEFVDTLSMDRHFYAAQCERCMMFVKVRGHLIDGDATEFVCETPPRKEEVKYTL